MIGYDDTTASDYDLSEAPTVGMPVLCEDDEDESEDQTEVVSAGHWKWVSLEQTMKFKNTPGGWS